MIRIRPVDDAANLSPSIRWIIRIINESYAVRIVGEVRRVFVMRYILFFDSIIIKLISLGVRPLSFTFTLRPGMFAKQTMHRGFLKVVSKNNFNNAIADLLGALRNSVANSV